ncbi:hypothetical protein HanRHA438_Chr15g0729141 [Helianthus annuus]|nr:hypothetical protein HanRHA438_Chr15g0729141 [Helianthus annuus]
MTISEDQQPPHCRQEQQPTRGGGGSYRATAGETVTAVVRINNSSVTTTGNMDSKILDLQVLWLNPITMGPGPITTVTGDQMGPCVLGPTGGWPNPQPHGIHHHPAHTRRCQGGLPLASRFWLTEQPVPITSSPNTSGAFNRSEPNGSPGPC